MRSPLFWRLALGGAGLLAAGLLLGGVVASGRLGAAAAAIPVVAAVAAVWIGSRRMAERAGRLADKAAGLVGAEPAGAERDSGRGDELARLEARLDAGRTRFAQQLEQLRADRNQLTAVLGGMVEGVVAVDLDRQVLHLNAVAAEWFGRSAPESAVGRPVYELSRQPELSGALIEAMEKRRRVSRSFGFGGAAGPDADQRRFDLNASPLLAASDGGELVEGAVAVIHETSELERLEGMRRDFVSNVSHELKTPLTAIHGYVETLLEPGEMDAGTRRRFLRKIRKQSSRLGALVSDLLTLSRIESSAERPENLVDLREQVDEVLGLLRPSGEARGLELVAECPEAPVNVQGEEEALRQALSNLVDNAVKYSAAGGQVLVRLQAENGRAVLEVEDEGPGIAAEHLDRIFERFYRVDRGRSRELGGTGLGLSIVKNVVQRHGGGVEVESERGRGSTFRFWLPAARDAAARSAARRRF